MNEKFLRSLVRNLPYQILMILGSNINGEIIYQKQIANKLNKPLTTINYHITKFKQEGLINKDLSLTQKGLVIFKKLWDNVDKPILRAHNIQVVFKLSECPPNLPESIQGTKSIYSPLNNKKYRGIKTIIKGFTCMFYSKEKIVCCLPQIYAENDEDICFQIQSLISDLISILEDEFSGIKIKGYKLAKIQSMHIAITNSYIAKSYLLLKGFTEENSEFAIDSSHGTPELEITNPEKALSYIEPLKEFDKEYNSKINPYEPYNTIENIKIVLNKDTVYLDN